MTAFSKEVLATLVTGGAIAVALVAVTAWYQYNKRKNSIPEKWMEVGTVARLFIYPLKSGKAIKVDSAECTKLGLVLHQEDKISLRDRGILVYKEQDGEFRSGKHHPKLLLITITALNKFVIKLEAPDKEPLIINTLIENPKVVPCSLWGGEPQQCIDCGNEAAEWISQYCCEKNSGLRLGLASDWKRTIEIEPMKSYTTLYKNLGNEDLGIFSDLSSGSILNMASLEDLNNRLDAPASLLNFRPNIVIKGPEAYAEDNWNWIKIGEDVVFRNVKPCTRCTLINVDPDTGIPEQSILKKLKEYRQLTNKKLRELERDAPVMGVYIGLRKPGYIKQGDKVYIG